MVKKKNNDYYPKVKDFSLWVQVAKAVTPMQGMEKKILEQSKLLDKSGNEKRNLENKQKLYFDKKPNDTDLPLRNLNINKAKNNIYKAQNQLTGIDRRTRKKLTRGQMQIEASLDLHGYNREMARGILRNFLVKSRQLGRKLVLVITGKGNSAFGNRILHGSEYYDSVERRGILRRELPVWLNEEEFFTHVVGFQPAHPKHGGGGAFYVYLRKLRK